MGSVYGAGSSLMKGYARDLSLRTRYGMDAPVTGGED
jgi:hypothetical protein